MINNLYFELIKTPYTYTEVKLKTNLCSDLVKINDALQFI